MDIKNWTWRKRISEKSGDISSDHLSSIVSKTVFGDQLEWGDRDGDLKLQTSSSEVTSTDAEAKQHAKVAEEAVAGWEKAEAETESVKRQLDAVLKEKAGLQERLSQLDGALKDCTRQVRLVREEQEQKRQDLLQKKNKEVEKVRIEYEAKLADAGRQLLEAGAENKVMAMTLQEQVRTTGMVTDVKSRAEAEIKVLQQRIESLEKDKGALKYEVHILNKQIQIRNEARDYSKRDIDNLNNQHTEDVKKINRLEAECQRLRILVRRKLPGPNALAQMKHEAESLDGGGETRRRGRSSEYRLQPNGNQEIELLLERLLSMEEETKMLKEVLAQRNGELHSTRMICAKTATRLSALEAYFDSFSRIHGVPKPKLNGVDMTPSVVTISENGTADDEVNRADAWASALIAELSQFKKDKLHTNMSNEDRGFDIMDDFTDMERLAATIDSTAVASEKTSLSKTPTELTTDKASVSKSEEVGISDELPVKRKLEQIFETQADCSEVSKAETEELKDSIRRGVLLVEALAKAVGISSSELDSWLEKLNALTSTAERPSVCEFVKELLGAFDILISEFQRKNTKKINVDSQTQTSQDETDEKVELEMVRVEKLALETHMKIELSRLATMETELSQLRIEKLHLQHDLDAGVEKLEQVTAQFGDAQQLIDELQVKLAAGSKEEAMVVTEVEAQAQSSGNYMQDVVHRLEKELEEEYKNHAEETTISKQPTQEPQESVADDRTLRKEHEIADAEEKLADCQRTILALGKQLKALSSSPHHSIENSMESRANSLLSVIRKHSDSEGELETSSYKMFANIRGPSVAEEYAFSPTASPMQQQKHNRGRPLCTDDYFSTEESSSLMESSDMSSPLTQRSSKSKRSSFSRFFIRTKSSA